MDRRNSGTIETCKKKSLKSHASDDEAEDLRNEVVHQGPPLIGRKGKDVSYHRKKWRNLHSNKEAGNTLNCS